MIDLESNSSIIRPI